MRARVLVACLVITTVAMSGAPFLRLIAGDGPFASLRPIQVPVTAVLVLVAVVLAADARMARTRRRVVLRTLGHGPAAVWLATGGRLLLVTVLGACVPTVAVVGITAQDAEAVIDAGIGLTLLLALVVASSVLAGPRLTAAIRCLITVALLVLADVGSSAIRDPAHHPGQLPLVEVEGAVVLVGLLILLSSAVRTAAARRNQRIGVGHLLGQGPLRSQTRHLGSRLTTSMLQILAAHVLASSATATLGLGTGGPAGRVADREEAIVVAAVALVVLEIALLAVRAARVARAAPFGASTVAR